MASPPSAIDLDELARDFVVKPGVACAAVVGVGVWTGEEWAVEVGACGHTGRGTVDEQTIFDLASVSKPFLAVTHARLREHGRLGDERLLDLLNELEGTWAAEARLEALLSHRSGLAAHAKLFAPLEARRPFARTSALRFAANAAQDPTARAGQQPFAPLYSDLGYLLAGAAMARASGAALDELVAREVLQPLALRAGSARQWQRARAGFNERVAPTEQMTFRGELRGVVHDENAWALAGHGFAGHAGLFGTVRDVLGFGMALLDGLSGRRMAWLSSAALTQLVASRPGGTLRLGFDGKSSERSAAGPSASAHTFGHLGFTGTSFWCDPMAEAVTVLLTNRVFPSRENDSIRGCRPVVHEALFARARALHAAAHRAASLQRD